MANNGGKSVARNTKAQEKWYAEIFSYIHTIHSQTDEPLQPDHTTHILTN